MKLISADGAKIEPRLVNYQVGQPDGTAWPSSAANNITTGRAQASGVTHSDEAAVSTTAGFDRAKLAVPS